MKKLLFLILLFASSVLAQSGPDRSNPLGADLQLQDAGVCSTKFSFLWQALPGNASATTVNLAGTFSATVTVRLSNNSGATWSTAGTQNAVGTASYSTTGFTDLCADVTTFVSGKVSISINTGLLQVQSVVTTVSGGGITSVSSLPGTCTFGVSQPINLTTAPGGIYYCSPDGIYIQDSTTPGTVTPANYGVFADVKLYRNAQWSNPAASVGNPVTVTWVSGNGPAPAAADAVAPAKIMQATNWDGNDATYILTVISGHRCTVTSVVVGTSWTCAVSNGWNASTGTGVLMVGHDDTTAWGLAYNAAAFGNSCLTIVGPGGGSFIAGPIGNTTPTCFPGFSGAATHYVGYQGPQSGNAGMLIPTTDFNDTSCPGIGSSYLFGIQGVTLENFTFMGFGINPATNPSCSVITTQTDGTYINVTVAGWHANSGSSNVIGTTFGASIGSGSHWIANYTVDGAGGRACVVTGFAPVYAGFCGDTIGIQLNVNSGATWVAAGPFGYQTSPSTTSNIIVRVQGTMVDKGSVYINGSGGGVTTNEVSVQSGAVYSAYDVGFDNSGCGASCVAIGLAASATVHLRNSPVVRGGATAGAFFCTDGTSKIYDEGGNFLTAPFSNTCTAASLFGNTSVTGTAQTAANITPTSGFGTGCATAGQCVSAVSGSTQLEQFTMTYGTGPSSPQVLTIVFPVAFFVTPICSMSDVGGTNAFPTSIVTTTCTTTGASFTITNTPVGGSTDILQVSARVP